MPHYELRVATSTPTLVSRALERLPRQFPEIEIVERHHDDAHRVDVWICRAPGIGHLERWATASALPVVDFRPILGRPHHKEMYR